MNEKIGSNLKDLAKVLFWVWIILVITIGISLMATEMVISGVSIIAGGILTDFIVSYALYGLGHLITNSDELTAKSKQQNQNREKKAQTQKTHTAKKRIADNSIEDEEYVDVICPECGATLSYLKREFFESDILECPMCDAKIKTNEYT